MKKPPSPPALPPLSFSAEVLIRDLTAITTALLQGRESCEGRIHFKVERGRPVSFNISVGDLDAPR